VGCRRLEQSDASSPRGPQSEETDAEALECPLVPSAKPRSPARTPPVQRARPALVLVMALAFAFAFAFVFAVALIAILAVAAVVLHFLVALILASSFPWPSASSPPEFSASVYTGALTVVTGAWLPSSSEPQPATANARAKRRSRSASACRLISHASRSARRVQPIGSPPIRHLDSASAAP
jgi:hypothetical protein